MGKLRMLVDLLAVFLTYRFFSVRLASSTVLERGSETWNDGEECLIPPAACGALWIGENDLHCETNPLRAVALT